MEREKKFVEKIIIDARNKKEQLKNEAKNNAEILLSGEEQKEKEFFSFEKKTIKEEFDKMIENEKNASFIEQTKLLLGAKQQILCDVFNLALQKMKKLSARDYQTFLRQVLTQSAENGDGLIVSNRKGEKDKIQKMAIYKKKKLKVLKQSKDISGGVIIVSKTYEKDFSFEGLIQDKFENDAHKFAKQLF